MATAEDIKRLTRRSEALKSLSLGDAPQLDSAPFARFPEMQMAVMQLNNNNNVSYTRLKNLLAEALINLKSSPGPLTVEVRTSDPSNPVNGQMWLIV